MAGRVIGHILELHPGIFKTTRASWCVSDAHVVTMIVGFAFRKAIDASLSTVDRMDAVGISVFGAECICHLSRFLNYLCTMI
jgi:hypothetical protein